MPLPNNWAARQISPDEFDHIVTKKNQGGDGIDFLIGFRKDGTSAVQSVHFDKSKYDEKAAKAWLKKHKMKASIEGELSTEEDEENPTNKIIDEAGKRNAKRDAKALNYAMRCMMSLLDETDFEEETLDLFTNLINARSQKAVKVEADEEKTNESEEANNEDKESEIVTESWGGLGGETFNESFAQVIEGKFDEKQLVIHDMVILGPISKNGYRYPKETQEEARPLFEGAKAYLNHPTAKEMGEARRVQDLIGEHRNIRVKNDKTYSDLHLLNNPTVRDYVLPILGEGKTHLAGNSIVVRGSRKKDDNGIEYVSKIHAARSVDLVAEPATTNGLFESQKFTTDVVVEEKSMEWTDVTVENLRKERPDLVDTLLAGDQQQKKMVALEAENAALKEQNAAKDKELTEVKAQRAADLKEANIVTLMAEAKIPDSVKYEEGTKTIKPHFKKALDVMADEDGRKEMIAGWEATFPMQQDQQKKEKTKVVTESRVIDFSTAKKSVDDKAMLDFAKAL